MALLAMSANSIWQTWDNMDKTVATAPFAMRWLSRGGAKVWCSVVKELDWFICTVVGWVATLNTNL